MKAFICATPYHVFISINIKNTIEKDTDADIYVINSFKGSEIFVEKLKKQKIFRNVFYVETNSFKDNFLFSGKVSLTGKVFRYWEYRNLARNYNQMIEFPYDQIYYAYPGLFRLLLSKYMIKRNKDMVISLFEDGFGGYNHDFFKINRSTSAKRMLFGLNKVFKRIKEHLVYNPDMFIGKKQVPVRKIPYMDYSNSEFIKSINEVFSYKKEKSDYKYIILEQPSDNSQVMEVVLSNIIHKIVFKDKDTNVVVKLHPRSQSTLYDDFNIIKTITPWEVICGNIEVENKILISNNSTACLTPKYIYNKEPYIIFICEIDELKTALSYQQDFRNKINKFIQTYNEPNKIFIPKSIEELNKIIAMLD